MAVMLITAIQTAKKYLSDVFIDMASKTMRSIPNGTMTTCFDSMSVYAGWTATFVFPEATREQHMNNGTPFFEEFASGLRCLNIWCAGASGDGVIIPLIY